MGNREDLVALESRLEQSRFEQSRFEQSRLEQSRFEQSIGKMSESEAQDAFITFDEFGPILAAVKADMSATGCKEDYIEGLKVFDKESTGKVPLAEVANCLASLGEKLDAEECDRLMAILGVTEDEDGFVMYEEFIANLLSKCP